MDQLEIGGYKAYRLKYPEGVYVIKQCIPIEKQLEIGELALNKYIYEPFRTNLFIY